jgi:hypothetical protein
LAYTITAQRENETVRSERVSELIAIAKARVWASEGWLVVISDGKGKSFGPAEFDDLLSFPTRWCRRLVGRPADRLDQCFQKFCGIHSDRLTDGHEFDDIDPPFPAFVLGDKRLRFVKSLGKFVLGYSANTGESCSVVYSPGG